MSDWNSLLKQLSDQQLEAVLYPAAPLVIFAGPGSGKTTVISLRALQLLHSCAVNPNGLYLITFTKAAALEMKSRLSRYASIEIASKITICTFHSLFLRILLRHFGHLPVILTAGDQRKIARTVLSKAGRSISEEKIRDLLAYITSCKNNLMTPGRPEEFQNGQTDNATLYQAYEAKKKAYQAWDYDDILLNCYQLIKSDASVQEYYRSGIQYVMVDEFQDTNKVQFEVLKCLTPKGNLTVVGDDDQSIYRFRGSDVSFLLNFSNEYTGAHQIVLSNNYRSTGNIIRMSQALIRCNAVRQDKNPVSMNEPGTFPTICKVKDERAQAKCIAGLIRDQVDSSSTVGILYRTHKQAHYVVEELVLQEVLFHWTDSKEVFYAKWQVQDIIRVLQAATVRNNQVKRRLLEEIRFQLADRAQNHLYESIQLLARMMPYDGIQFIRNEMGYNAYLDRYAKRIKCSFDDLSQPLEQLLMATQTHHSIPDFLTSIDQIKRALRTSQEGSHGNAVWLSSFHGSKGLEFDYVCILDCVEGIIPHRQSVLAKEDPQAVEEERRLFYVACTRAKQELFLYLPDTREGQAVEPSRFLNESLHGCPIQLKKNTGE